MLLEKIKSDLEACRKTGQSSGVALLSTLYSEAAIIGKNSGNRQSTDEEVIRVIRKFIKNAEELFNARRLRDEHGLKEKIEIEMLEQYLPKQLTDQELSDIIIEIISNLPEKSPKMMGQVMNLLKEKYSGLYDGKLASTLVKKALS